MIFPGYLAEALNVFGEKVLCLSKIKFMARKLLFTFAYLAVFG